jgi:hypothetical protein
VNDIKVLFVMETEIGQAAKSQDIEYLYHEQSRSNARRSFQPWRGKGDYGGGIQYDGLKPVTTEADLQGYVREVDDIALAGNRDDRQQLDQPGGKGGDKPRVRSAEIDVLIRGYTHGLAGEHAAVGGGGQGNAGLNPTPKEANNLARYPPLPLYISS